jgi:GDPmannose 4,6-dehydratase
VETADINALGTMRILEAMKQLDMMQTTKFYQASTSELYGDVKEIPQTELTPFHPRSPYGVSKLYAFWALQNYKESYGLFGCNGILFNHESPRRGTNFVTRKITSQIAETIRGDRTGIQLGNLNARRDWGHAKDYVRGMWQMLQHDVNDDYVLATGETRTIRDFVDAAYAHLDTTVEWTGSGVDEVGIVKGKRVITINPAFYRPAEVALLLGSPNKAETVLGWKREFSFEQLVADMMQSDINNK